MPESVSPKRSFTFQFVALVGWLLLAPVVGVLHHHGAEHDGASAHVEAPHGSHLPALVETDDRIPAESSTLASVALPAALVSAELPPRGLSERESREQVRHPARAPPTSHRPRAPPTP